MYGKYKIKVVEENFMLLLVEEKFKIIVVEEKLKIVFCFLGFILIRL